MLIGVKFERKWNRRFNATGPPPFRSGAYYKMEGFRMSLVTLRQWVIRNG